MVQGKLLCNLKLRLFIRIRLGLYFHEKMPLIYSPPKCFFKVKNIVSDDGALSKILKAGLIARGLRRVHGLEYDEIFVPVVSFTTGDLERHQMGIKTAFQYGDLGENIRKHIYGTINMFQRRVKSGVRL